MISFDNLFKLKAENLGIEKDPQQKMTLVSHAHSDHIPSGYKENYISCSQITEKIIQLKKKLAEIKTFRHKKIEMKDAGHILGSKMFLIDKKFLYTGDFNPKGEYAGLAKPVKCETMIIECTYGRPHYVFPSKKEVMEQLKQFIDDNKKVIITTADSSFGKPQEICTALEKMHVPFRVTERIAKVNSHINISFKNEDEKADVIISDHLAAPFYPEHRRAHLSGWCLFSSPLSKRFISHRGFPYSSHADYPSLIEFVEKSRPEKVYTHHGYAREFADDLKKLGYDAHPLHTLTLKKRRKGEYQSKLV